MNVLITGVTSFIGRALSKELISEGMEVYGTVRPDSENRDGLDGRLHIVECGMDNIETLAERKEELPDISVCVHLAWEGAGKDSRMDKDIQEKNVRNTCRLIDALSQIRCGRFIFAGSQAEYGVTLEKVISGKCSSGPVYENSPCDPVSEYGKAKLEVLRRASGLCERYGMTYIHLRIFSIYGKGDHRNTLISTAAEKFINNEEMKLSSCEQKWNFLNIRDCAKAISDTVSCVFTADENADITKHVINIASEDTRELKDFIREISEICGGGIPEYGSLPVRSEGTAYLYPSIEKLKEVTGFAQSISFKEGIKEIIEA